MSGAQTTHTKTAGQKYKLLWPTAPQVLAKTFQLASESKSGDKK